VGVKLNVSNLLMVGARNGDCGGEPDFDLGINGGQHCIGLWAGQGNDEVCEL
jgi:hypothetical protein